MGALRAFYWEMKMEIRRMVRYRFGLLTDIAVYTLLLLFFLLSDSGQSYGEEYGYADYKELLLVGYLAWMFASTAISSIAQIITGELKQGTFYKKYHSKYPLQFLLFARMAAGQLMQCAVAAVILILAAGIGHVKLTFHPVLLAAAAISTIGMYGIGLIAAGMAVFHKRIGSLIYIIQLGLLFITDTLPTADGISAVTRVLPLTSCNLVMRKVVAGQAYGDSMIMLCVTAVGFLAAGILLFSCYLARARKKGNLLFY